MGTPTPAARPFLSTLPPEVFDLLEHFAKDRRDITVDLTGNGPIFPEVTVAFPDPALDVDDRIDSVQTEISAHLFQRHTDSTKVVQILNAIGQSTDTSADLARWVVVDETVVPVNEREFRNPGTHATHCCTRHGCKYGPSRDCAVKAGAVTQEYPCEFCGRPESIPSVQIVALRTALAGLTAEQSADLAFMPELDAIVRAAEAIIDGVGAGGPFDDYANPYEMD